VTATNSAGSTTTTLSITVTSTVAITTQPTDQSVPVGTTATFSVVATSTGTLSYQWLKNGVAIAGATAASYTTPVTTASDDGTAFSVKVSDSLGGSVTSSIATLTVT
jgi:hypothetical protein